MTSKIAVKDDGTNKQFKPQIYQSKRREQTRNFYDKCNYDQRNYQNRYRSNLVVELSMDKIIELDQGMNKTIGMNIGEKILEATQECTKIRF